MKKILLLCLAGAFLAGCTTIKTNDISEKCNTNISGTNCNATEQKPAAETLPLDLTDFDSTTAHTLLALKNKDITTLKQIASSKGIRFSPYAYIDVEKNIILTGDQFNEALSGSTQYVRGNQDGSGEPIIMTFKDYLNKFVYDVDFLLLAEKYLNQNLARGNTINNSSDIYSGKQIIEYYVPGIDPKYEGMDRRSLSLVFEQEAGQRKLIGIIHNQWTI